MKFSAVLFDLDGTLLDTIEDLTDAVNQALSSLGAPPQSVASMKMLVGEGARSMIRRALPDRLRSDDVIEMAINRFRPLYAQNWQVKTRPYTGIVELLTELERRGVPMAVLSNKPQAMTEQCVSGLLPGVKFAGVLGERPGIARKPDPAGAREAAALLGTVESRVVYLGDTAIDMKTAVDAGMFPVGALWGFRGRGELEANGAKEIITAPAELLRFVE